MVRTGQLMSHSSRSISWMILVVMLGTCAGVWLFSRIDPNRLRKKPVGVVAKPVTAKAPAVVTYRLGQYRVALKL
jgi:hypothetical protein